MRKEGPQGGVTVGEREQGEGAAGRSDQIQCRLGVLAANRGYGCNDGWAVVAQMVGGAAGGLGVALPLFFSNTTHALMPALPADACAQQTTHLAAGRLRWKQSSSGSSSEAAAAGAGGERAEAAVPLWVLVAPCLGLVAPSSA